jgi:DNA-binding GntR family transcriptional regulator
MALTKLGTTHTYPPDSPQAQVYTFVKDRVLDMTFKPGVLITDTQIASMLNISRTPVREVLHLLAYDGLLRYEFGRGWKVDPLTLKEIQNLFEMKIALETMMVGKAAGCEDEAMCHHLEASILALKQATVAGNSDAWWEAETALAEVIFAMADNERAAHTVYKINVKFYRVWAGFLALPGQMTRSSQEYDLLVGAVLARDTDRAELLCRQHLERVQHELEQLLVNMVLPFVEEGI